MKAVGDGAERPTVDLWTQAANDLLKAKIDELFLENTDDGKGVLEMMEDVKEVDGDTPSR